MKVPTYIKISEDELKAKSKLLAEQYLADTNEDIAMQIHMSLAFCSQRAQSKFWRKLLNYLKIYKLEVGRTSSKYMCLSKYFLKIPATVASAERSFNKLKLIPQVQWGCSSYIFFLL